MNASEYRQIHCNYIGYVKSPSSVCNNEFKKRLV